MTSLTVNWFTGYFIPTTLPPAARITLPQQFNMQIVTESQDCKDQWFSDSCFNKSGDVMYTDVLVCVHSPCVHNLGVEWWSQHWSKIQSSKSFLLSLHLHDDKTLFRMESRDKTVKARRSNLQKIKQWRMWEWRHCRVWMSESSVFVVHTSVNQWKYKHEKLWVREITGVTSYQTIL